MLEGFITAAASGKASFKYWLQALRADPGEKQITRDQLDQTSFQRGDLIIFYAAGDVPIHLAVATGDKQNVYSLWNTPRDYPSTCLLRGSGLGATTRARRSVGWYRNA